MQVSALERNRSWDEKTVWTVMDYRSAESMFSRLDAEAALSRWVFRETAVLGLAPIGLTWGYVKVFAVTRELWLMFFTKLTEYQAYGTTSVIFVLFCGRVTINSAALGDSTGYLYYGRAWSRPSSPSWSARFVIPSASSSAS